MRAELVDSLNTDYDYESIMHYGSTAFGIKDDQSYNELFHASSNKSHCVKNVLIRSYSGPYSVRMWEIWTRINPNTVSFHAVNSTNFYPLDTGRKLNVDETYGRPPGCLKSILYALNFRLDTICNFRRSFLLWWLFYFKRIWCGEFCL